MWTNEYKAPMNLQLSVNSTLQTHHLIQPGGLIVVGVSGGTDSLALLHLLASLRESLGVRWHVATLDHGLRGEAGADDARFVVAMAQRWNIPVTAGYADVTALARTRSLSIEAAARVARYDFLAAVARETGADRVAVAHNADDQVETVLLHLLRGAGISGLAGMAYRAPLPGHPDLLLIRPLLDVRRADLDAYCRAHDLQPRHDASNDDQHYTRNRLRHDLIPHLRDLSAQIDRRLLQLAEVAAVENDFVNAALQTAVEGQVKRTAGRVSLPRTSFAHLHPALQLRFIIAGLAELAATDVTTIHLRAAADLALSGQVGAVAQFPHGLRLRVDYADIHIEREVATSDGDLPLLPADAVIPLAIPGITAFDSWQIEATLTLPQAGVRGHDALAVLHLSPPRHVVEGGTGGEVAPLILRGRRAGDRFAPPGLVGHTQKLSKWMIDHKIPRDLRDRVPLVLVGDQIAAIYWGGWFVSASFSAKTAANEHLYLTVR